MLSTSADIVDCNMQVSSIPQVPSRAYHSSPMSLQTDKQARLSECDPLVRVVLIKLRSEAHNLLWLLPEGGSNLPEYQIQKGWVIRPFRSADPPVTAERESAEALGET